MANGVRVGDVVFREGQGFSERRETVQEELRRKAAEKRGTFVSGSGRAAPTPAPAPTPTPPPATVKEAPPALRVGEAERTPAFLVEQRRQELEQLRREAGTFGRGLGEAQERAEIQKFIREQERRALIEEGERERREQFQRRKPIQVKPGERVGIRDVQEVRVTTPPPQPTKFKETKVGEFFTTEIPGIQGFKDIQRATTQTFAGVQFGTATAIATRDPELAKKGFETGVGVGRFKGEVQDVLTPSTPAQIAFVGGTAALLPLAPPAVATGVGIGFGVVGTAGALNPQLTPQERVASGVVGGLGFAGAGLTLFPFVKGQATRLLPSFKRTTTETFFFPSGREAGTARFVRGIRGLGGESFDIGIIPEGTRAQLPGRVRGVEAGEGAVLRGGFGFTPSEQFAAFSGKSLRLTTSQRGLIQGRDIVPPSTAKGQELGFFFTPADPVSLRPQTRVSRLGLQRGFFEFTRPRDVRLGLVPGGQPEIIVTERTFLSPSGRGGARIAPKGTTELEVTAFKNIEILGKRGDAIIKGQRVPIYESRLTQAQLKTFRVGKTTPGDVIPSTRVTPPKTSIVPSAAAAFSAGVFTRPTGRTTTTRSISSTISPPVTRPSFPTTTPTIPTTPTRPPTTPTLPTFPTRPITTPTIPGIPTTPTPPIRPPTTTRVPPFRPTRFTGRAPRPTRQPTYTVEVRRFGKFKPIATGLGLQKAVSVGATKVGGTLAATFRLTPTGRVTGTPRTPKGFRRKKGLTFVEAKELRLSTKGETREIQTFKSPTFKSGKGGIF